MGFNTTLVLLNDALHYIKNDEKFGEKVYDAASKFFMKHKPEDVCSGGYANAATVVAEDHADTYRCLIVGGNGARDLGVVGHWSTHMRDKMIEQEIKEMFLKNLADSLGFRIVRKKK